MIFFFFFSLLFFKCNSVLSCSSTYPCEYCSPNLNEDCEGSTPDPLSNCTICEAGYYCPDTRTKIGSIEGYVILSSGACDSSAMDPCPPSMYQNDTGQDDCKKCPAGHYCPVYGMDGYYDCAVGEYCPEQSQDPLPCGLGFYCPDPAQDRVFCDPGKYCDSNYLFEPTGNCSEGYYCDGGAVNAYQHECQLGYYCGYGYVEEEVCGIGNYCPETTKRFLCTPGEYCETNKLLSPTGPCEPGYYCPEGSSSGYEVACTLGGYCPGGTGSDEDCGKGYYCKNTTSKLDCPLGWFCNESRLTEAFKCTTEGMYCPINSENEVVCGFGYYCPSTSEKIRCTVGYYCDSQTLIEPTGLCPQGYYCPEGTTNPFFCDYSYFCPNGSSSQVPCNCSGNGDCYDNINDCHCDVDYGGNHCQEYKCFGHLSYVSTVCSSRGKCIHIDDCDCDFGFVSNDCSNWTCYGVPNFNKSSCSGHGSCVDLNTCQCGYKWKGFECKTANSILSTFPIIETIIIAASVSTFGLFLLLIIILISAIIIILFYMLFLKEKKKTKRFSKFQGELEILEVEEKESIDSKIAKFSLNKKFFMIDGKDITLKKKLGRGAFGEVFLCDWEGKNVAMKMFQTNSLSNDNDFDNFEKELSIFSSVSHPNITRFYACSIRPPRVGIVLEYCSNGDLQHFIAQKMNKQKDTYPFLKKLVILSGVSSAVSYLHRREIIHRDLKSQNVLINEMEEAKLCDFGLSRIIAESSMTKRTGTSCYMAPEVVLSSNYTNKCDVFSFSVIMFVTLTQDLQPYKGIDKNNLEIRIAQNPSFRPKFNEEDYKGYEWYIKLMKACWEHDAKARPSFKELFDHFRNEIKKLKGEEKKEEEEEEDSPGVKEVEKKEDKSSVSPVEKKKEVNE